MSTLRLILRNLLFFRAASLAVIIGVAVATAVLAGALMVGDSVRGSLRALAVQRLGKTDYALAGTRFFDHSADDSLMKRLAAQPGIAERYEIVPGVIVNGGARVGADAQSRVAGDVQIVGLADWVAVKPDAAILNSETAASLRLGPAGPGGEPSNEQLVFSFPSMEEVAREGTIARRQQSDTVETLPIDLSQLRFETQPGMVSLFNLNGGQRVPRNAWVNFDQLQEAVEQPDRANVLLVHDRTDRESALARDSTRSEWAGRGAEQLNAALRKAVKIKDYGLDLKRSEATGEIALISHGTFLDQHTLDTAAQVAARLDVKPRLVTVNLANRVIVSPAGGGETKTLHYCIGSGISSMEDLAIKPDEILFNEATAAQLRVEPGDSVELVFFRRDAAGNLQEHNSAGQGMRFRVGKSVPMTGLGADQSLTPNYKGLTDVKRVGNWSPPPELGIVGKNKDLAEQDNDAYWEQYQAAPRFFIHIDAARKLWGGPFGEITSMRFSGAEAEKLEAALRDALDPARMGLSFRPIKAEQVAAASGSTDFSMLFVGFSFFLIVAAALLVAMLLRLNVERRARQIGVLAATGFTPKQQRRIALAEGMTLAAIGALVGLAGAVGYTWVMVYGLRTWWVGAVGTTALELYVHPMTLVIGFAASLLVAFFAVLWGVWRVGRTPPARLLAGAWGTETPAHSRSGRMTRMAGILLAAGGVLFLAMVLVRIIPQPQAALGGGAMLLVAGLVYLVGALRPRRAGLSARTSLFRFVGYLLYAVGILTAGRAIAFLIFHSSRRPAELLAVALAVLLVGPALVIAGWALLRRGKNRGREMAVAYTTVTSLGVRNASRHTARSVLSIGLIAFAAFTLITVASMRRGEPSDTGERASGAGGYRLIVQTSVPLLGDPGTPAGRKQLSVLEPDNPLWQKAAFMPLRRWAGQDISCLNLTRPDSPTILGVPHAMVERGGFAFAQPGSDPGNWKLIEQDLGDPAVVPVIADNETATYILKLGVGDEMTITDQTGTPRRLRLVATLSHSIFQSEMLMSEANFRRLFPAQSGFGTVLVDVPAEQMRDVQQLLSRELEPYAASVDTTASRLAMFNEIQDTYLSTFQALGSLGLALGTIGLAVVLVRNVIERRPELALLSAVGFQRGSRVWLVLSENAFLLLLGLGVGTICALLGITPTLLGAGEKLAYVPLLLTLAAILVLGFAASSLAVWLSGLAARPADLRNE